MNAPAFSIGAAFHGELNRLLAQSLTGRGALLDAVLSGVSKDHGFAADKRCVEIQRWILLNQSQLLEHIPPVGSQDLVQLHGQWVPVCIEPAFFSETMEERATTLILRSEALLPVIDRVQEILKHSIFTPGNRRSRTSLIDGRIVIEGEDDQTYRSLFSITHELGHCLYETGAVIVPVVDDSASEAFAHLLEGIVMDPLLSAQTGKWQQDFHAYQRRIDALNLAYFGVESRLPNPWSISLRKLVSPTLDVFRESLFMLPGYQLHYANASFRRLNGPSQGSGRSWKWNS
jgi:hypothetical protein